MELNVTKCQRKLKILMNRSGIPSKNFKPLRVVLLVLVWTWAISSLSPTPAKLARLGKEFASLDVFTAKSHHNCNNSTHINVTYRLDTQWTTAATDTVLPSKLTFSLRPNCSLLSCWSCPKMLRPCWISCLVSLMLPRASKFDPKFLLILDSLAYLYSKDGLTSSTILAHITSNLLNLAVLFAERSWPTSPSSPDSTRITSRSNLVSLSRKYIRWLYA